MTQFVLASDHAGLQLRAELAEHLASRGVGFEDLGPTSPASVDYPDFAARVAGRVGAGQVPFGVLVCGTGIGMCISANKVAGVRAALCSTEFEARMARAHNDANVLCLGQRTVGAGLARAILDAFLDTPFEGGRHAGRVAKMRQLEEGWQKGR
jgi:ribose 5-phosphate isomerase B